MVLSICDVELLRLLAWCGNIQPTILHSSFDDTTVQNLIGIGLVRSHKNSGALTLTPKGQRYLIGSNIECPERYILSYREDLLQRRLRVARIVMTGYCAQLGLFAADIHALAQGRTLFLPSLSRGRDRNVWGSSRIAALFRLGKCCYSTYSVFSGVGRLNLEDEEKTLSYCVSQSHSSDKAFFFAGDSYPSILAELERKDKPNEGRLISYGEAWQKTLLPVHLLSCDSTGAVQLQIMAQPGYRNRLAQAALKDKYQPTEIPAWDALFQGMPFVVAVDMDLRRLDAAVRMAREQGLERIAVAALAQQAKTVLIPRYQNTGQAKVFALTDEAVSAVTKQPPTPYVPPRTQFLTEKGDVVDAPPIRLPGKAGGQAGRKVRALDRQSQS